VERQGQAITAGEAKLGEHMREQVWGWLSAQAGEWAEHLSSQTTRQVWETAPVQDDGPSFKELADKRKDDFVNTPL
jgi:hypothetical protein